MEKPLLLNGFMATGKSTVGKRAAEMAGRPFLDLDQLIESRARAKVSDIFRERGEPAFRLLEGECLREILSGALWGGRAAPVVALGGGALLDRSLRVFALGRATVVTLTASAENIAQRAQAESARPLLSGDGLLERTESLLEQRQVPYLEAHAVIDSDSRSIDEVAAEAIEIWKRDLIAVAAGTASYAVEIGRSFLAERLAAWVPRYTKTLLVTDQTVMALHGSALLSRLWPGETHGQAPAVCALEPGESHKNLEGLNSIWARAHEAELDRKSLVLALGGGVVTDMGGFGAATWMRGIDWIALPSTLLSMVDAAIGGKTAIDYRDAKNAVGSFWQPRQVLCDVDLLKTEPMRGFTSALSEVVKTALIGDRDLFEILCNEPKAILARDPDLVTELVRRSVRVKAHVVSIDQREGGVRAHLNLGHTIGHALEAEANYVGLTHGEAVSLGLVAALRIGEKLGASPSYLVERVIRLLGDLGLPVQLDPERLRRAADLVGRDKKRAGSKITFLVAREVGTVERVSLTIAEVQRLTSELAAAVSQEPTLP